MQDQSQRYWIKKRRNKKAKNVFQVLDGLSWEEVKNMQDAQTSQVDGYGGMKVKLLFVASIFPHFSFFLISFIF